MNLQKLILIIAVGTIGLVVSNARAADKIIDEVRFGATVSDMVITEHYSFYEYDRMAVDAELLFSPLDFDRREAPSDGLIHALLTPRIHLGGILALEENGISSLYSGLTWHYALTSSLFLDTSFGPAIHNGEFGTQCRQNRC